jgi:hypothetical protein
MKELPLSFEEENVLQDKFNSATRKVTLTCVVSVILFFIFMMIPQKYLPIRGSDHSENSILGSGGMIVVVTMLVFGTVFLLAFLTDLRYFGLKKDLYERTKIAGQAKIIEVKRAAIDEQQADKQTIFILDAADKKYKKLFWMEGNLYQFNSGDTIDFECGKHSRILLNLSKP